MTTITQMYAQLMTTGQHMVHAASTGDWHTVSHLESLAKAHWASIRHMEQNLAMTVAQRRNKHAALLALLRFDAQVRALAEPGWTTLAPYFRDQVPEAPSDKILKHTD